ncbi:hypothetical protein CR513_25248, partial [Mucuna pruriens]
MKVTLDEKDSIKEATNIAELGGVTRSGRVYTPDAPMKKISSVEVKGAAVENAKAPIYPSSKEILAKGRRHNQPLHIFVKCGDYTIARVLIDNGSSINILPKTTLNKLCSTSAQLRASSVVVRAFDGSKREVMGNVTLLIYIGPTTFDITFQVMDIRPAYNYLLGRSWIHSIGVVPSSLHQRVKFFVGQQLINIYRRGQGGLGNLLLATRGCECYQHWIKKPRSFQRINHGCPGSNQRRIPTRQRAWPPPERYSNSNLNPREAWESQTWLSMGQR